MAKVVCRDAYCERSLNRENSHKMTFREKAIIGSSVLLALAVSAIVVYELSRIFM